MEDTHKRVWQLAGLALFILLAGWIPTGILYLAAQAHSLPLLLIGIGGALANLVEFWITFVYLVRQIRESIKLLWQATS